jgi:hypothetical protein
MVVGPVPCGPSAHSTASAPATAGAIAAGSTTSAVTMRSCGLAGSGGSMLPASAGAGRSRGWLNRAIRASLRDMSVQLSLLNHQVRGHLGLKGTDLECQAGCTGRRPEAGAGMKAAWVQSGAQQTHNHAGRAAFQ